MPLFGLMVDNDKPIDGFQQKRESKPKTLSWDFYRKLNWWSSLYFQISVKNTGLDQCP